MKESFINAVEAQDLRRVRLSLCNELLLSPSGESFTEMRQYAQERLPDLFEVDDEDTLEADYHQWDQDYMNDLHSKLSRNFSERKLNHLAEVVKIVLAEKIRLQKEDSADKPIDKTPLSREGVACIAGGAAVAIAGFIAEATFWKASLITLGIATIVYGVYSMTKK